MGYESLHITELLSVQCLQVILGVYSWARLFTLAYAQTLATNHIGILTGCMSILVFSQDHKTLKKCLDFDISYIVEVDPSIHVES